MRNSLRCASAVLGSAVLLAVAALIVALVQIIPLS
jgi:hypothetical protein